MGGEGEGREQGVDSRSPTRDERGHSHNDHQKRDFQVSEKGGSLHKGTGCGQIRGARGEGLAGRTIFMKCCTYMYHCTGMLTSNECCV